MIMNYSDMQKLIRKLKEENISLKRKVKVRDNKIREMERSGPDAALLKANIELANEVHNLKEDIEFMKRKKGEETV